jgi:GT2 family glycosyltransferase
MTSGEIRVPTVSVVVPVYDRADELVLCIKSLQSQRLDGLLQVIVVDDASPNRSVHDVALSSGVGYVRLPRRRGSGYAKNVGLSRCRGELVLFVDSDARFVSLDAVANLIEAIRSSPAIGSVGGEGVFDRDGVLRYACGRMIDGYDAHSWTLYVEPSSLDGGMGSPCDYIPTSNCMTWTNLARQSRGFDDAYRQVGEDKDFGYRLGRLGYKALVVPDGVIWHGFSRRGRDRDGLKRLVRTQVRFCLRHFGWRRVGVIIVSALLGGRHEEVRAGDEAITRFEDRYRRNVLRIGRQRLQGKRTRRFVELLIATAWNLAHLKGLATMGTSSLELGAVAISGI